jgi:hypothetical protein
MPHLNRECTVRLAAINAALAGPRGTPPPVTRVPDPAPTTPTSRPPPGISPDLRERPIHDTPPAG